ncbi:uncharacterized protein LY89DRAFT_298335 [Mollisia scopiformis]|uniref:Uncharacterized protein n=1 Tax=Mollisia scopiformis TaxID=149040 RepID=A0A194XQH5_MOLSC|nr:uncharacterized protein LY89DRAFT_298335 [Mollisia scopiformis]KUJ22416.1 hypothetical protein LY89DRAFT_298335 [Mollisia scopiformis]
MHGREEWRSPHDKPFNDIPMPPVPKSTAAFSLKNAGRTLSWGRNKPTPPSPPKESSSPTIEEEQQSGRSRAVTASSYASTATPPKLVDRDLGLSLGGDFSDMFSGFGKRKSVVMDAENNRAMSQSPDTLPTGPANRSYTANRLNPPSALSIDRNREVEASPYSWSSQHSRDGLISSSSPPPFAPRNETPPPPVPQHGRAYIESPNSFARPRPGGLANNGLRRSSAVMEPKRQSTLEYNESVDEDARLLRESINAARQLNDPGHRARDSWLVPSTSPYSKMDEPTTYSSWRTPSTETTPRAKKAEQKPDEDNLFDTQIAAAANVANRYQMKKSWTTPATNTPPQNKVMTPAQFERYKQDQERLKSVGGQSKDKEEDNEDETYDDDEDDAEKAKQAAKQRRKQEAHMAVYRQQMMKVTGEAPSAASRPSMFATQSSPNLAMSGKSSEEAEEEDEEVPLAILQAHGFPSKNKPPMRSMGSNPNLRSSAGSTAGGVVGSGNNLPVFARNLPQDPYFGASVVNPMHRESLSFGGGSGSVSGAPSRGLPPGGLVGVIASEERSRAMRRGSPNMQGEYGPSQPPCMNGMGMQPPQMGGSMYNGMGGGMPMGPMGPMGPIIPMMLTPGDQAQIQMTQQMQQFMQMQMQFMQMMTGGGAQQNGHMPHASMGDMPRPGSAHQLRPAPPQHQRAMTMLEPNTAPWMQNKPGSLYAPSIHAQGNGYAPSIAPSERSNVGLPGRYRPVSQAPVTNENKGRTSSMMSGALQNWDTKNASTTIRAINKSGNVSDEDDEEGWEEMAKKREKKKSVWRIKKDKDNNGGLREMLHFA